MSADSIWADLLDGYVWRLEEGIVDRHVCRAETAILKACLLQGIDGDYKLLYGPVDAINGCVLPVSVSQSPLPVHSQRGLQSASPTTKHGRGASFHPISMAHMAPRVCTTRNHPGQPPATTNAWTAGVGYHGRHLPQHSSSSYPAAPAPHPLELGQVSPSFYSTARLPRMSISSRDSKVSQQPLTHDTSTFSRKSSVVSTPPRSAKGSISSTSTSSSTLRGTSQLSQLGNDLASLDLEPKADNFTNKMIPPSTDSFRVAIGNLKLKTTKKEVNDLLEQKIQMYLHYSEMKLVETKGQLLAEISFKDKDIADRVVHKLNSFRFKDRKLQVQLLDRERSSTVRGSCHHR